MADSSPLADLLDRARNVFSLAGELGRAFGKEHELQAEGIDPADWEHYVPKFKEFSDALLDLRDAIQNPPDGFGPVSKPLWEAVRIAKKYGTQCIGLTAGCWRPMWISSRN